MMRVRLKLSAIWLLVAGCVVEEGEHHDLDAQIANLRKSCLLYTSDAADD